MSIEKELQDVFKSGIIPQEEWQQVSEQIRESGLSPLTWLHRRGLIDEATLKKKQIIPVGTQQNAPAKTKTWHGKEEQPRQKGDADSKSSLWYEEEITDPRPSPKTMSQFPFGHWERYEPVRFLGRGGMGEVYQAFDPRLKRHVAIKFLLGKDPTTVKRFINEARAQARVDHDHICKVFEVGEINRHPYIAMQYIQGEPLQKAAVHMSLEQKLMVMKNIAEGVHEAHRAGLIHRDLKPGNIMVEKTSAGVPKPYVLDFGLARYQADPTLTVEGSVLGTPSYMSPEQVRGETGNLDRRMDVYGLGATLYHILDGDPPFRGASQSLVLLNVLSKDPRPLKENHPEIPRDVESIVFKALEKRPSNRYDSAKAFAEDLGRYLDGEPVKARPGGLLYKLEKKARKNKLAFTIGAVASLLLAISLGWGLTNLWRADVRERLTRNFTQRVVEVESLARFSHMSPIHDIRPDRERMRRRMEEIHQDMEKAGDIAKGPGHYALGRGFLALGDLEAAHESLDKAWQTGYREPRVAYALGSILGDLYRERLQEARLVEDEEERELAIKRAEEGYRNRALAFMEQSVSGDNESPEYLRARIALYQDRFEDALTHLSHLKERLPWFYEAYQLQADIYRERAYQRRITNPELAQEDLRKALETYDLAQKIGPSDPSIYRNKVTAINDAMSLSMFQENIADYYEEGLTQAKLGLQVFPQYRDLLLVKVWLHLNMGDHMRLKSKDPTDFLGEAIATARQVTAMEGHSDEAHILLGKAYWSWANWLKEKGNPFLEMTRLAMENLKKVEPAKRDYHYYATLGPAQMFVAEDLMSRGEASLADFKQVIEVYDQGLTIFPNNTTFHYLKGVCLLKMYNLPGLEKETSRSLLEEGIRSMEAFGEANPEHLAYRYYTGLFYLYLAKLAFPHNSFPDYLEKSIDHFREGQKIQPKLPHLYTGEGEAHYLKGRYAWEWGQDYEQAFQTALDTYGKAIEANPAYSFTYHNMAWVYLDWADFFIIRGKDPNPHLKDMFQFLEKSQKLRRSSGTQIAEAIAYLIKGTHSILQQNKPTEDIDRALALLNETLDTNPKNEMALNAKGRSLTWAAMGAILENQDPTARFLEAKQTFDTLLALAPKNYVFMMNQALRYRMEAAWRAQQGEAYTELVEEGRRLCGEALKLVPNLPRARALDASLGLLALQHAQGERDRLTFFRQELARVTEGNPHLGSFWIGHTSWE